MPAINPYLTFNGNCEEAFNFYQSVFGGETPVKMRYKEAPGEHSYAASEGEKIVHVSLPIGKNVLMGSDMPPSMGQASIGNNFSISISVESEAEVDRLVKGLAAGGKVTMPPEKTFWGAYFAMLVDPYGIHWMVSYDYNQKG